MKATRNSRKSYTNKMEPSHGQLLKSVGHSTYAELQYRQALIEHDLILSRVIEERNQLENLSQDQSMIISQLLQKLQDS